MNSDVREPAKDVFEKQDTYATWDSDYYTPISLRLYDGLVARMVRDLHLAPGTRVLDAGCGPGVHAIRVAQAGHPVHAIDFSSVALREAESRIARAGVSSQVTLEQADLTALPFPDASFQGIFSWGVVIHIPQAERALDELARILAPGGRLALYLSNDTALDPKVEWLARKLTGRAQPPAERLPSGLRHWYELHGERLCVWRFDVAALVRHMGGRGLVLVKRRAGEFTDIQRRTKGKLRAALQHLNNVYARLGMPPQLASANLLVFEKPAATRP